MRAKVGAAGKDIAGAAPAPDGMGESYRTGWVAAAALKVGGPKGLFDLRASQPSAQRVYRPAAPP